LKDFIAYLVLNRKSPLSTSYTEVVDGLSTLWIYKAIIIILMNYN